MSLEYSDVAGIPLFRVHEKILPWLSMKIDDKNESKIFTISRRFITYFLVGLLIFQFICTIMAILRMLHTDEYDSLGPGIGFTITTMSCLDKFWVATRNEESIKRLAKFIQKIKQQPRESHKVLVIIKHMSMSFYISCLLVLISWTILPILTTKVFPIPSVYPFPNWFSHYFRLPCHIVCVSFLFVIVTYTASVAFHSLAILSCQLDELAQDYRHVMIANKETFRSSFQSCSERHLEIMRVERDLNRIMNGLFLFQVLVATLNSTFTIYGSLMNTQFYKTIVYNMPLAMASTIDFTLFCKMGEDITRGFAELHRAVYEINWYELPPEDRRYIIITQEVTKKPILLKGGKVFTASLQTYVEVLRQSFSLYVLVRSLTNN